MVMNVITTYNDYHDYHRSYFDHHCLQGHHHHYSRHPSEDISRTPEDWTKIVILIVFVILIIIMIAIVVIVGKIFIAAAFWRTYLTLS